MRILVLAHDVTSVLTSIRLREPLQDLCASAGWTLSFRNLRDCHRCDLGGFDVLVVQRGTSRRAVALMHHMQRRGGQVVYEIDDLLLQPAAHLRDHLPLRRCSGQVRRSLALADVVTVPTERLADALRPLARRVERVPNFAPAAPPRARAWIAGAPLTLVLAASDRIAPGVLADAVLAAQALRPGRIRVVCIGLAVAAFEGSAVDCRRLPLLSRHAFWHFMATEPNAVLAIPLDDSPFSACKSAAKFFDCAAIGVPVLCADRPPYADAVIDGCTGTLVADSVQAWQSALVAAVDGPQALLTRAQQARDDVARRFGIDLTVAAWRHLLEGLPPRQPARSSWLDGALTALRRQLDDLRQANHRRLARRRDAHAAAVAPAVPPAIGGKP